MNSIFKTFLDVLSNPNPELLIEGECTLRYVVELKGRPTFTSSKRRLSIQGAKVKVEELKKANKKAGYMKYSCFKLYSKNNMFLQDL